jgi:hypothetical protein
MNPTTESRLVPLVHTGNITASQELIVGHRNMVFALAGQCKNGGGQDEFDELVSIGELALCESVSTFKGGCRFSTHAYLAIRRSMIEFQRTDGGIKPEWETRKEQKLNKQVNDLSQELRRTPTFDEFEEEFGVAAAKAWADTDYPAETPVGTLTPSCGGAIMQTATEAHPINCQHLFLSYDDPTPRAEKTLEELTNGASLGQLVQEWDKPRADLLNDVWEHVG